MANANDRYSQNVVTPAQRGRQIIGGEDGNCFDAWVAVEQVENAHNQQGAPTNLYDAPLDIDSTNRPAVPGATDFQDDYLPERTERIFQTYEFPQGGPAKPPTSAKSRPN